LSWKLFEEASAIRALWLEPVSRSIEPGTAPGFLPGRASSPKAAQQLSGHARITR
jgi:hypothetical protein